MFSRFVVHVFSMAKTSTNIRGYSWISRCVAFLLALSILFYTFQSIVYIFILCIHTKWQASADMRTRNGYTPFTICLKVILSCPSTAGARIREILPRTYRKRCITDVSHIFTPHYYFFKMLTKHKREVRNSTQILRFQRFSQAVWLRSRNFTLWNIRNDVAIERQAFLSSLITQNLHITAIFCKFTRQ